MLKFIFALKVLCCVYFYGANGDCDYPFEEGRLLFYQNVGPFHVLLPGLSSLPENQAIVADCSWGFEKLRRYYDDESSWDRRFVFMCISGNFHMWHPKHNFYPSGFFFDFEIKCPKEVQRTYMQTIAGCRKNSLIKADNYGEIKVVYAEVCFDIVRKKLEFVHFVVANRSPILEDQEEYNPSPAINLAEDYLNAVPSEHGQQSLTFTRQTSLPPFTIIEYKKQSLLPHDNFSPYLRNPNLGPEVEILWWMPLKHGNWYMYERLAKKLSKTVDLDIYAGASHNIQFNQGDKCMLTEILDMEVRALEQAAPLYVWNYVRRRNTTDDEGLAVIGLNIPFYDVSKSNYTDICTDICDTIDWLTPLTHTRKMPALGYIFCCRVDDVKSKLFGFPLETNLPAVEHTTPGSSICEGANCKADDILMDGLSLLPSIGLNQSEELTYDKQYKNINI